MICKHMGVLINQGIWWCELQRKEIEDKKCKECPCYEPSIDYDKIEVTSASTSIYLTDEEFEEIKKEYSE